MKRAVLAVLLGLLLLLLFPASAKPQVLPTDTLVGGKRVADSLRIASEFWHTPPHCTTIRVYRTSSARLRAAVGSDAAGATYKAPLDKPAEECPIWMGDPMFDNTYKSRIDFCTVIVHEYGHILGLDHDDIQNSIMNVTNRDASVYACYRRFLPRGKGWEWRFMFPDRVWARAPW